MELKNVKRNEVEEKYTWDLTSLCKNDEEFEKGLKELEKDIIKFQENYRGKIKDKKSVEEMLVAYEDLIQRLSRNSNYAYLQTSVEQGNPHFKSYKLKFQILTRYFQKN